MDGEHNNYTVECEVSVGGYSKALVVSFFTPNPYGETGVYTRSLGSIHAMSCNNKIHSESVFKMLRSEIIHGEH